MGTNKHKSFYGFYPSEVFGIKDKEVLRLEDEMREYDDLAKLKQLYSKCISSSLGEDLIIQKCEYSKTILKDSMEDINTFNANSQRTGEQLIPFFSLLLSVLSVGISFFNVMNGMIGAFLFYTAMTIVSGTVIMYIVTTKQRTIHSKEMELYRNMLMCFETVEEMVREKTKKRK